MKTGQLKKYSLSLFAPLWLLSVAAFAQPGPSIELGTDSIGPGQSATTAMTFIATGNEVNFDFRFTFDNSQFIATPSCVPTLPAGSGNADIVCSVSGNTVSVLATPSVTFPIPPINEGAHSLGSISFQSMVNTPDAVFPLSITEEHFTDPDGTTTAPEPTLSVDGSINVSSNTPPVADAGPPQAVNIGDTVALDGSGSSDAEEDLLTYHWSFVSKPTGSSASLDTTDPVRPSFAADTLGSYVLRLIVNDSTVDSTPDTVEITAGCSGDMVTISNTMFHSGVTSCIATESIIVGPNVIVKPGTELWLDAPMIELRENVLVESGGILLVRPF